MHAILSLFFKVSSHAPKSRILEIVAFPLKENKIRCKNIQILFINVEHNNKRKDIILANSIVFILSNKRRVKRKASQPRIAQNN